MRWALREGRKPAIGTESGETRLGPLLRRSPRCLPLNGAGGQDTGCRSGEFRRGSTPSFVFGRFRSVAVPRWSFMPLATCSAPLGSGASLPVSVDARGVGRKNHAITAETTEVPTRAQPRESGRCTIGRAASVPYLRTGSVIRRRLHRPHNLRMRLMRGFGAGSPDRELGPVHGDARPAAKRLWWGRTLPPGRTAGFR